MITFNDLVPENMASMTAAFARVLASGRYIGGEEVEAFEKEFAAYVGSGHCIAVGNGFDALQIALKVIGVENGESVGVPTNTCIPTWAAVHNVGATPYPIEPSNNYLIDDNFPEHVKAVIPVHLYGNPIDSAILEDMCQHRTVIEDACQAHGSYTGGRHVGTFGDMGCFSFYPTKNLGAFGDGGAIVTDDWVFAEECRELRRYGKPGAINSCLDPIQAAFLRVKLKRLDEENERRRARADLYRQYLAYSPYVILPPEEPNKVYNYHQFVIRVMRRDELQKHLADKGIETMVHYRELPANMFMKEYLAPSMAFRLSREVLSLPIANTTALEIEQVCEEIINYYGKG